MQHEHGEPTENVPNEARLMDALRDVWPYGYEEVRALLAAVISDCPCVDAEDEIVVEEWMMILAAR